MISFVALMCYACYVCYFCPRMGAPTAPANNSHHATSKCYFMIRDGGRCKHPFPEQTEQEEQARHKSQNILIQHIKIHVKVLFHDFRQKP